MSMAEVVSKKRAGVKEKKDSGASKNISVAVESTKGEATDNCGHCKGVVKDEDSAVQCELCYVWFHCGCAGIDDTVYPHLGQAGLHWFCKHCNSKFAAIMKSIAKLEERQTGTEAKVIKIQEDLVAVRGDCKKMVETGMRDMEKTNGDIKKELTRLGQKNEEMEGRLKKVEEQRGVQASASVGAPVPGLSREDIVEQIEIDKRKGNLILMGIKEEENEWDTVNKLVQHLIDQEGTEVVKGVERIGKRVEEKDRPVRIVLASTEARFEILKCSPKLKGSTFDGYYISPDLTPKQQLQDKNLRDKLKALRQGGATGLKIKKGTIVKNLNGREEIVFPPSQQA